MLSNEWRNEAFKQFPELHDYFQEIDNPYSLWEELIIAFDQAYEEPRNDGLIKRIYEYGDCCLSQPQGETAKDDLATCVAVCFFEHIPEIPEALEDMPRWFTREDVLEMKPILSYQVGEEGYAKVLDRFDRYDKEKNQKKSE
jgi:hypothetical protein